MDIQELIKNRKEFVDAQLKNGFDLTTVLVGLYSDASHFIYEILQNAEDAKATEITFDLQQDKLIINHNGIPFTDADIDAITGISNLQNDKKRNLEKIGKFGIGFKSVYAVTESPRIQSGIYDFQIIDFVLPDKFSDNNDFIDTTITLNFDQRKRSSSEIFELIENKFENFEHYNLLFLSNLKKITLKWNGERTTFSKNEKLVKGSDIAFNTTISLDDLKSQYLVFKTNVQCEEFSKVKNKPNIAIAFEQNASNGVLEVVKSETSNLFAFFETGYDTLLNFFVQAPFSTTPARDNIDFKLPVNISLLNELELLMKRVLIHFKENKSITIDFLNQLPLNYKIDYTKVVYRHFFNAVKEEFLSEGKYLPTMFKNNYQAAQDLALVRGRELTSLISSVVDMQVLFGKKYWMDTKITTDKTTELYNYLIYQLNIKEYTPDDFARKVTDDFFVNKTDSWMIRFYEFLNGKQESLWRSGNKKDQGALRQKAIIRLSNGEHSKPYDANDKPIVFLPIKKQDLTYTTVSAKVLQSKGAMSFITDKLGIREPNYVDQIRQQIIPLYKQGVEKKLSLEKHFEHIQFILDIYSKGSESIKSEIVEMISNDQIFIFLIFDLNTTTNFWGRASDCYIESDSLKQYFRFTENVYFLNDKVYTSVSLDLLHSLAIKCGAKNYPRIIQVETNLSQEKKKQLRISAYGSDEITQYHGEKITDYSLFGFDDIMNQKIISKSDSLLLWYMLLKFLKEDSKKDEIFKGRYSWFRNYSRNAHFTSQLLLNVRDSSWLYSNENVCVSPNQITLSAISVDYELYTDEAFTLIKKLQFKEEAEQILLNQLSPEKKELFSQFEAIQKLCNEKGIDLATAITEISKEAIRDAEKLELESAPDIDDMETEEDDFVPFDDSSVEGKEVDNNPSGESDNSSQEASKHKPSSGNQQSQQMRNDIGERGEKIAFKHLKKIWSKKATLINESDYFLEFQDTNQQKIMISLLNSDEKKGIGCDLIIRKDDEIVEYIEVKSTKMMDKDLFPINGYQWSFAQKLFKSGQGNKFSFYVVKNVLGQSGQNSFVTAIKNPIKKWKDGELKAHPVNLEL